MAAGAAIAHTLGQRRLHQSLCASSGLNILIDPATVLRRRLGGRAAPGAAHPPRERRGRQRGSKAAQGEAQGARGVFHLPCRAVELDSTSPVTSCFDKSLRAQVGMLSTVSCTHAAGCNAQNRTRIGLASLV